MEIGVMFWGGRDPVEILREVKGLGVRCGQIGVHGGMALDGAAAAWNKALEAEQFTAVTVVGAFTGEDYADIPTVKRTVGFIPRATRVEREARTLTISDFAAELGVPGIALHVGFVPEDATDPDYIAVREMVRRVADHAAKHNQSFALETGQEPAHTLLNFIKDVNRPNIRINFDPANMVLYGSGDPIEAVGVLAAYIVTVHCKDGTWPPKEVPGALGTEVPLGQGAVGIDRFIAKLKSINYKGPLCIEREIEDHQQRLKDIRMAVGLLEQLRAPLP
jgi:sugar phosphate isomerase/epimerase